MPDNVVLLSDYRRKRTPSMPIYTLATIAPVFELWAMLFASYTGFFTTLADKSHD